MVGRIYVFSGPSGAGKSTLTRKLRERVKNVGYSVSHTSRPPRRDEVNGVDYYFIDRDTFNSMIKDHAFVEWATVYTHLYGTSLSSLQIQLEKGLDVILDIDSQGAANIKKHFKECVLIYIFPPSLQVLQKRLRERATDDERTIEKRFRKAVAEMRECEWYDYLIVNDDLDDAYRKAESIIISERCRKQRVLPSIRGIFEI